MKRRKPEKEPEIWNGINLTELLEKSVPPKPKSNKVLDALIVVSLVLIVGSKLLAPRPLGAQSSGIVITAREYGSHWPFEDQKLRMICERPNEVQLRQDATSARFALTNAALNSPIASPSYHALLKPGANTQIILELIQRGLELCPPTAHTGRWPFIT